MAGKRPIAALLAIVLGVFVFLPGNVSFAAADYGKITGNDVNMRAEPNTDSEIITKLKTGDLVLIIDKDDEWYHIAFDEKEGYVMSQYVYMLVGETKVGYAVEDGLKLRGAPSTSSYIVTELKAGIGMRLTGFVDGWYQVSYEGNAGYIHSSYVSIGKAVKGVDNYKMLQMGMQGSDVAKMQEELKKRNFFRSEVSGNFGSITRSALIDFQKVAKLTPDGMAGTETLKLLYGNNNIRKEMAAKEEAKGQVKLLSWFKGGSSAFSKGTIATVIDVRTGITFKAQRFGGWYHADSEPLTKADTANFKKAAGGSWTWNRRPIWLKVGNNYYAASMNCKPHMVSPSSTNGFPGHFCIHFYESKVHENNKQCPRHQACVMEAYEAGK